ncbi:enhanced intracellular survival protein Eis [Companilactobacillus paralimentarius]|uniref:GNAT family N-acetyltransferase n=1 Tax=Companilactobacillus paralimentarius TaxID=83526 RepID=UPI00384F91D2
MAYILDVNDFDNYKDLFLYSFNYNDSLQADTFLKKLFKQSIVYGIKNNNDLIASITNTSFQSNFFGKKFNVGGIGNVMSAPENTKNNSIDLLMEQSFKDMYDNKVTLSYLAPFSYDYYRRFGYEQVFEKTNIEIPFSKTINVKESSNIRIKRCDFSEAENLIGDIYERNNTFGGVKRDSWYWNNRPIWFNREHLAVAYDKAEEVKGYIIYYFQNKNMIIDDFVWEDPQVFLSIFHFINKHRSMFEFLIIKSTDSNLKPICFTSNPSDANTTISPYMMARIVNLSAFMNNYPFQKHNLDEIIIDVSDSLVWNNNSWKLKINNGQISFVETNNSRTDIFINIQTLTKAMFGFQSLKDSFMMGNVGGDLNKINELDSTFIKNQAKLKESF